MASESLRVLRVVKQQKRVHLCAEVSAWIVDVYRCCTTALRALASADISTRGAARSLLLFFLFDSNPNLAGVFDVYRAAQ